MGGLDGRHRLEYPTPTWIHQGERSGELYDVLLEGICAWQKLFRKYNPKTMARGLRVLVEAVNPPKAKGLHDIEVAVAKWEEKSKMLTKQFGEGLSERMKMGVFTSIMPIAIQDYIYTRGEGLRVRGSEGEGAVDGEQQGHGGHGPGAD